MQQEREATMSLPFSPIHPSVLRQSVLPDWVPASRRAHGALRYRCPTTGSFVLLTDPAALAQVFALDSPVRCPGCGDTHLLHSDRDTAGIVAPQRRA
jgi:hypothetical protein